MGRLVKNSGQATESQPLALIKRMPGIMKATPITAPITLANITSISAKAPNNPPENPT